MLAGGCIFGAVCVCDGCEDPSVDASVVVDTRGTRIIELFRACSRAHKAHAQTAHRTD